MKNLQNSIKIRIFDTQRNATQRNATQRNATQRNATQRNATQRYLYTLFQILYIYLMIYESLADGISKLCLQGIFVFVLSGDVLPGVMYYRGFTPPSIMYHLSGVRLPDAIGNRVLEGRHIIAGVCKPPDGRTINLIFNF